MTNLVGYFPSKALNFQETETQRDLRSLCLTFLICESDNIPSENVCED